MRPVVRLDDGNEENPEDRLKRPPTCNSCSKKDDNWAIHYELFSFHGGAPPYRGFHHSEDGVVTLHGKLTWSFFFRQLRSQLDPSERYDLSFELYENQYDPQTVYTSRHLLDSSKTVEEVLLNPNIRVRVYQPMARGMMDIGTFEFASSECPTTSSAIPTDILSLKNLSLTTSSTFPSSIEITKMIASKTMIAPSGIADELATVQVFNKPHYLSLETLQQLREYADEVYTIKMLNKDTEGYQQESEDDGDLKINLSMEQVQTLLGGAEVMTALTTQFFPHRIDSIILRRCSSWGRCIDFHTDYAVHTMQIAVNDDEEYVGGRLVYATGEGLQMPIRKAGTITLHDNTIVHGVTTLERGVRYGLVLLHRDDHIGSAVVGH
jgi:hypothetical protein